MLGKGRGRHGRVANRNAFPSKLFDEPGPLVFIDREFCDSSAVSNQPFAGLEPAVNHIKLQPCGSWAMISASFVPLSCRQPAANSKA
jgi:hypothetical protein